VNTSNHCSCRAVIVRANAASLSEKIEGGAQPHSSQVPQTSSAFLFPQRFNQ
jgi:hypothetical protein